MWETRLAGLGPRRRACRLGAGSPTRSLPRGNVPHPGHIRPGSQGPWGRVRGTGSSPCHPEDRAISCGPHFPARLPPPQRQSVWEELGTWGRDGVPAKVLRQVECVQVAGLTATDAFSGGESGLRSALAAESWLWRKFPYSAPRWQTWTQRLQLSKVCAKPPNKGV